MSSRRYKKLPEKTRDLQAETIDKLIPILKQNCTTKFDESLDLSLQINNKQKKSEVNIRAVIITRRDIKKGKSRGSMWKSKFQEAKDAGQKLAAMILLKK